MSETPRDQRDLLRSFLYHRVTTETANRMAALRAQYWALAHTVVTTLPASHERSRAVTALNESLMRAIQCIAVSEGRPVQIGVVHREGQAEACDDRAPLDILGEGGCV